MPGKSTNQFVTRAFDQVLNAHRVVDTDGAAVLALLNDLKTLLTTIRDNADQLEGFSDGLEGFASAGNALLTQVRDNADTIEALISSTNTLLTNVRDNADQLEGFVDGLEGLLTASNDGAVTTIAPSTSVQTALDANPLRRGFFLFNDSNREMIVKLGTGAAVNSMSFKVSPGGLYERNLTNYLGRVTVIWAGTAVGTLYITELT